MCQIDFSVMQSPHVLPILVTLRKILPRAITAPFIHSSNCPFTHSGDQSRLDDSPGQLIAAAEQMTVRGHPDRACRNSIHPSTPGRVAWDFGIESSLLQMCQKRMHVRNVEDQPAPTATHCHLVRGLESQIRNHLLAAKRNSPVLRRRAAPLPSTLR